MKKAISALLTAAVAFVLCFFVACGGNTQTEKDLAESVTLNRTELRLKEGEQALLKAYVLPIKATDNDTLWKSEDESIATVDGGIVTAEKAGETTVTVTVDDQTAVCTVYVSEKSVDVSYIKLNKFTVEMQAGDSETLTAVVLPDNATASSVVWASDNEDVVTVDGGVLTAKKAGRAIISAACGGKTAFCSVTVKTKQIEVTEISLNKTETELVAGESEKLSVTFNPSDATDKSAVWVSDNPAVASVSEGTIYARKAGSAVITVTAGGKTVSCTVTVKAKPVAVEGITLDIVRLEIIEGGEEILTAFVMPENATDKTVVWSTSDESIAAVENGVVTALKPGKAVITATAGEKSAVCEVTVIKKVIPVYSVTVNTALLELTEGGEETLTAVVMPENATDKTVVWSTSDESVAAVENGVVTALKPGKAVITATAGGQKAEVTVTVKAAYVAVSEIKVSKTALILGEGTSERVIASILPENATQQQLKWSSANTTVATVRDGIISGRKVGETVITVSADGVKTEIKVTVQAKFVAVTSVTLNKTSLELTEGDDEILSAAVMPVNATDKTVTWESSDEDVVSVENGVIVAKKGGRAVITATAGNKSANCTVTVKTRFVPVSEITLDKSYIELTEGDEETLTAVVMPENATDKTVVWSTSDESVAAVENGVITALKPGKAVITATAGAVSASCTVEVKERYYEVTSVELDKTTLEIRIGGTYTFTATILPENASNKTLVWESSDEDVLTVNGGTVTPVGVGKATVTVKAADGKSAVCEVTVKEKYIEVTEIKLSRSTLSMKGGAVRTLTATVMPENATDKTVVWSTSDESVAAVENGVVTALKPGKAVITATVGNKNATCTVTVLSDETHQEGYLWYEDFNGTVVPNYLRQQVEGTGAVTMTGTGMSLALSGNGKAFANYDFAKAPAGIVVIDVRMMATSNIFNGLFIYSSNNQPVISIAMDQGNIRNNSGRGWTTAAGALVHPSFVEQILRLIL